MWRVRLLQTTRLKRPQVEMAAVSEAPQVDMAAAPEAPEPAAYYEFLWCEFGENYSAESRDAYFADFNTIADSMTERGLGSFGYAPKDWGIGRF